MLRFPITVFLTICLVGTSACSLIFDNAADANIADANIADAGYEEVSVVVPIRDGADHSEQACRDHDASPCSDNPKQDGEMSWATNVGGGSIGISNHSLSSHDRYVALRYEEVPVCAGCEIVDAFVQFTAQNRGEADASVGIRAQLIADAPGLTGDIHGDLTAISDLETTAAGEPWPIEPWFEDQSGEAQRTPSIAHVIQEIVDLDGWQAGNSLVLVVTGRDGYRDAKGYSGGAAPQLHLTYIGPPPPP